MKTTIRRVICLLLVLCMVAAAPAPVLAATSLPNSVYLTQEGYSTCTLCAAAMMVRARMYLNGNSQWTSVTESGIRSVAWVSGMGLRWAFTYELGGDSVTVSYAAASGMSVETLKSILDLDPEGIVLYCGGLPHAVFATDYEGDTFYCAEPVSAYSGKRITLAESWLGHEYGSQATILNNVTAYWYVSKNTSSGSGTGTGTQTPECNCSSNYAGEYICTVGDRLNIRSGHGTGYSTVGSIPSGATVTVTKASGTGSSDWAHVTYNGISGYVSMQYLKKPTQQTALEITKHPEDVTAALGSTVSMSVEAAGDGLSYQWQWRSASGGAWNITSVSGNTTKTIRMEVSNMRAGCQYRCVVTDRYGNTAYSESATLNAEGGTSECSCSANYAGEYVCAAGEGSSLNIRSGHGTGYSTVGSIPTGATVTVTKAGGTGSSDWAHVTYNGVSGYVMMKYLKKPQQTALEITKHPEDVTAALGTTVSMSVEAVGDGLRYQWQRCVSGEWYDLPSEGKATTTLTVGAIVRRNGYQYRCEITDRYGKTVYSNPVRLNVVITENGRYQRPDSPWRKPGCPAWAAAVMVCRLPPDPAMVTVTDMVMDMVTVMAAVMDCVATTGTNHMQGTDPFN